MSNATLHNVKEFLEQVRGKFANRQESQATHE